MHIRKYFSGATVAGIALLVQAASWAGGAGELCAPFKDTSVDQSLVATMLKAAEQGEGLYRIQSSTTIHPSEFDMQAVQTLADDRVELWMQVDAVRYSG